MKFVLVGLALFVAFGLGRLSVPTPDRSAKTEEIVRSSEDAGFLSERAPISKKAEETPSEETAEEVFIGGPSIQSILSETDPLKRAALFADLLETLDAETAKVSFEALLASAGPKMSGREAYEMQLLLRAWGSLDGEGAMRDAAELLSDSSSKRGKKGDPLLSAAMEGWASKDLAAATAYVEVLEDKGAQSAYRASIVGALLEKGPAQAMAYIQGLPMEDRSRGRFVSMVANQVLEGGLEAAIPWMESLPEELRAGAMSKIADAYAREDLDEAILWATNYDEDATAKKALSKVTGRWAASDPRAVSKYLADLPGSSGKDAAVEGFATRLATEDPKSAAAWATTIEDEKLRGRTISRIASTWANQDKAAALAWLEDQGMTAKALKNGKRKGNGNKAQKRQR